MAVFRALVKMYNLFFERERYISIFISVSPSATTDMSYRKRSEGGRLVSFNCVSFVSRSLDTMMWRQRTQPDAAFARTRHRFFLAFFSSSRLGTNAKISPSKLVPNYKSTFNYAGNSFNKIPWIVVKKEKKREKKQGGYFIHSNRVALFTLSCGCLLARSFLLSPGFV